MPQLSATKKDKLSTRIHREFQDLLIVGEFRPGERLNVGELVRQTGTSITPVREALLQLVSESAVEMYSPRAFAIPDFSLRRFEEIRTMRIALEGIATEASASKLKASDIGRLAELHGDFVVAESTGDKSATLRNNRDFHFTIYNAADMPLLLSTIKRLWAMMGPILNIYYETMDNAYTGAAEHLNIIAAIQEGDAARAAAAMREDLRLGGESIELYIAGLETKANEIGEFERGVVDNSHSKLL